MCPQKYSPFYSHLLDEFIQSHGFQQSLCTAYTISARTLDIIPLLPVQGYCSNICPLSPVDKMISKQLNMENHYHTAT